MGIYSYFFEFLIYTWYLVCLIGYVSIYLKWRRIQIINIFTYSIIIYNTYTVIFNKAWNTNKLQWNSVEQCRLYCSCLFQKCVIEAGKCVKCSSLSLSDCLRGMVVKMGVWSVCCISLLSCLLKVSSAHSDFFTSIGMWPLSLFMNV